MDRIEIRKDTYFDSVFLMAASAELGRVPDLQAGYLVLATPENRQLLEAEGFDPEPLARLGPTDLVIALRAPEDNVLDAAAARIEALLSAETAAATGPAAAERPVGLEGGLARLPDANLALISVPGEYAAYETRKALARGLHVMIFSNNVPLEEEVALKQRAGQLDLLVMGPDCGTALVAGKPLGFANRVRAGAIGLVGASGTGLQEVACLIHRLGSGVTHILGTGGRDLKAEVGGRTTLAALRMLAADPRAQVLVVVSKPPAREVAARVLEQLGRLDKPSVVCFLGQGPPELADGHVHCTGSLSEAAWVAHCLATGQPVATTRPYDTVRPDESSAVRRLRPGQRWLHGLFTGGTLGGQALLLLRKELGADAVRSNLSPPDVEPDRESHTLLDLGDDRYTRGRPHPMIDPTPRCEKIVELGSRPETALLLLDLVLGHGCHPDPAAPAAEAVARAVERNPGLVVVASITGTDLDPQNFQRQEAVLERAGVQVLPSAAAAASFAGRVIQTISDPGKTREAR
jgi:FdrA protein